jgi:hypothetical protein
MGLQSKYAFPKKAIGVTNYSQPGGGCAAEAVAMEGQAVDVLVTDGIGWLDPLSGCARAGLPWSLPELHTTTGDLINGGVDAA